jgi:hypothetical protein
MPVRGASDNSVGRYGVVRAFAVRLLAGETIALVDRAGRHWIASATQLVLVQQETPARVLVLEGDAYDVAVELATIR